MLKEIKRQCLQTAARFYTERNRLIVSFGGSTATDMTNIYLRYMDNEILQGIKAEPSECWIATKAGNAHEAAHIIFSDKRIWDKAVKKGPLIQHLVNILEDARIERAMSNMYPGTMLWLRFSNEYIFRNRKEYGSGVSAFLMGLCAYAVVGKIPEMLEDRAKDLIRQCADYINEARLAKHTSDVLEYAEEIAKLVKDVYPEEFREEAKGFRGTLSPRAAPDGERDPRRLVVKIKIRKPGKPSEESKETKNGSSGTSGSLGSPGKADKSDGGTPSSGTSDSTEPNDASKSKWEKPREVPEREPEKEEPETSKPEESEESSKPEEPEESSLPEESEESDKAKETEESGKTDESKESDKPEESKEPEKSKDEPSKSEEVENPEDPGYTEEPEEHEEPEGFKGPEIAESEGEEPEPEVEDIEVEEIEIEIEIPEVDPELEEQLEEAEKEIDTMKDEAIKEKKASESEETEEVDYYELSKEISKEKIHRGCGFRNRDLSKEPERYRECLRRTAGLTKKLVDEIRQVLEFRHTVRRRSLKRGTLDTGALWKLQVNGTNVFAKKDEPGDIPQLTVKLLVDCSGSMSRESRIERARDAAVALHEMCNALKIKHAVTGFTSLNPSDNIVVTHFKAVEWDERDGSKIPSLRAISENRDGYSVRVATKELLKRHEPNKLLIVLSDGMPLDINYSSHNGISDTAKAVREAERLGVNVIGIYFGEEGDLSNARYMYNNLVYAPETNNLPFILGRVMKKVLTG